MTRFVRKVALLALLPMASVWGSGWESCGDCGGWTVGAEALIWTHTDSDFNYADDRTDEFVDGPLLGGTEVFYYVDPGFDVGVRVHGTYRSGCHFATLSYSWLEITNSQTHTNEAVVGFFGTFEGYRGGLRVSCQNVDLAVGCELCSSCRGSFGWYGNVRWIDLEETRNWRVIDSGVADGLASRATPEFWGLGLGMGVGGQWTICNGLELVGRLGLMGFSGEQRAMVRSPTTLDRIPAGSCFVPSYDYKVGLTYSCGWSCYSIELELAYEFQHYFHALTYNVDFPLNADFRVTDIGFGGPLVGLRVGF